MSKEAKVKVTIVFIFVIICIISTFKADEEARNDYARFNAANIDGRLKDVKETGYGVHIFLDDSIRFMFRPYTSKLNDNKIFSRTAKRGDIIRKKAYSDTLLLITSDGKEYRYTFHP